MQKNKIDFRRIICPLPKNTNKKQRGHLLVVAGSRGMTGAAVLAVKAAFRAGAGIVTLAFPEEIRDVYSSVVPDAITLPMPSTREGSLSAGAEKLIKKYSEKANGVVIGPGLSKNTETQELIKKLITEIKKPLIIDADALTSLADDITLLKKRECPTILTPHEIEMGRLLKFGECKMAWGEKFREEIAGQKAKEWKIILTLKGYHTIVTDGARCYVNLTGGPALAKAGTGDVLAGLIGGLLVQKNRDLFTIVCLAVYLHGLAGDLAANQLGTRSVMASDVINFLPRAIKQVIDE